MPFSTVVTDIADGVSIIGSSSHTLYLQRDIQLYDQPVSSSTLMCSTSRSTFAMSI